MAKKRVTQKARRTQKSVDFGPVVFVQVESLMAEEGYATFSEAVRAICVDHFRRRRAAAAAAA